MRALVTGGTGFVGSAVVRALLAQGAEVVCLVRPAANLANLEGLAVERATGDLADVASLRRALSGCSQLYHVAAYYGTREQDAELMARVNVDGTRNILLLAAELGLERIVHTSTIGTIGQPADGRLATEEDLLADDGRLSAYVRTKLEAETIALELGARGAPVVVVNPCAPVGARDIKPSSTGQRILDYLAGRTPSFSPGGINFIDVDDVAQGHLLAAQRGRPGARYILGHAQGNLDLLGFYVLLQRASGSSPPGYRRFAGARQWTRRLLKGSGTAEQQPEGFRPSALTADPSRALAELGLPQTPLEDAFARAVRWFRLQGYVSPREG